MDKPIRGISATTPAIYRLRYRTAALRMAPDCYRMTLHFSGNLLLRRNSALRWRIPELRIPQPLVFERLPASLSTN